ncbi:MAG TPA: hypothetical protein VF981_08050 [Gemmatimonadaceae bacterium]
MFGSEILDVAIGVVFVFLIVSIICSAVREGMEAWLKSRAAYLEHGIRMLLHDMEAREGGLARAFYDHPLIRSLSATQYKPGPAASTPSLLARGRGLPSYIPAQNFSLALLDIAARGPATDAVSSDPAAPAISLESVRLNVRNLGSPAIQRLVLTAIDTAEGDLEKARRSIEAWFDSGMERVSGWYKRTTGWILFWIGLAVAVVLNINAITIGDYLYRNSNAREAVVARAQIAVADTGYLSRSYQEARAELDSLRLPMGWSQGWGAPLGWLERPDSLRTDLRVWRAGNQNVSIWNDIVAPPIGWLIIAIAATMGAPFWFDLLNKFMVIRSTVKPNEKSPPEASEDRQVRPAESGRPPPTATDHGHGRRPSEPGVPTVRLTSPDPRDAESARDGCEAIAGGTATRDEDLPAASGGVA